MLNLLAVFIGGSIGATLRFLISEATKDFGSFFFGTLIINTIGCLFLGFVTYIALAKGDDFNSKLKLFLTTGIAGGFTTFSTFNYEIFKLFQTNQAMLGFSYMFTSLFLGLFSIMLGMYIAKRVPTFAFTHRFAYQEEDIDESDEDGDFTEEAETELELTKD